MRQAIHTPQHLGQLLQSARKAAGLTQSAAAARLDLSQSRLSQLESDPGALTVERLLPMLAMLGLELVVQNRGTGAASRADW